MKIHSAIRSAYQEMIPIYKILEVRVKEVFEARKPKQWFFLYRIKEEESFALKLETGRVLTPKTMEDFFACTLVVENRTSIRSAVEMVEQFCEVVEKRPPEEGRTHKPPDLFCFDDLRLYVRLKGSDELPPSDLNSLVFEIQIKTFLQHAWAIATHDLVYKGGNVNWGRARVAFQIKAMLEHAETSVEQVDEIAKSSMLAVTDKKMNDVNIVIQWLSRTWAVEWLPSDLVRLAENILSLCRALQLTPADIEDCVAKDTQLGLGATLVDLTPFMIVVHGIVHHQREKIEKYLKTEKGSFRVFIGADQDLKQLVHGIQDARPNKYVAM